MLSVAVRPKATASATAVVGPKAKGAEAVGGLAWPLNCETNHAVPQWPSAHSPAMAADPATTPAAPATTSTLAQAGLPSCGLTRGPVALPGGASSRRRGLGQSVSAEPIGQEVPMTASTLLGG